MSRAWFWGAVVAVLIWDAYALLRFTIPALRRRGIERLDATLTGFVMVLGGFLATLAIIIIERLSR